MPRPGDAARGDRKAGSLHVRIPLRLLEDLEAAATAAGEPLSRTVRRRLAANGAELIQRVEAGPGAPPPPQRGGPRPPDPVEGPEPGWRDALLEAGRALNQVVRDLNLVAADLRPDRPVSVERVDRAVVALAGALGQVAAAAAPPRDLRQIRANLQQLDRLVAAHRSHRPSRAVELLLQQLRKGLD